MKILLIIILIIMIILLFPLRMKVKFVFNIIDNKGCIAGKILNIRLLFSRFYFIGKTIVMVNKKNKVRTFVLTTEEPNNFGDILAINLIQSVKYRTAKLYTKLGYKDNAFLTAMLVAIFPIPINLFEGILLSKKSNTIIKTGFFPSFCEDELIFGGATCVDFNFFILLKVFIISLKKYLSKGVKHGKRVSD